MSESSSKHYTGVRDCEDMKNIDEIHNSHVDTNASSPQSGDLDSIQIDNWVNRKCTCNTIGSKCEVTPALVPLSTDVLSVGITYQSLTTVTTDNVHKSFNPDIKCRVCHPFHFDSPNRSYTADLSRGSSLLPIPQGQELLLPSVNTTAQQNMSDTVKSSTKSPNPTVSPVSQSNLTETQMTPHTVQRLKAQPTELYNSCSVNSNQRGDQDLSVHMEVGHLCTADDYHSNDTIVTTNTGSGNAINNLEGICTISTNTSTKTHSVRECMPSRDCSGKSRWPRSLIDRVLHHHHHHYSPTTSNSSSASEQVDGTLNNSTDESHVNVDLDLLNSSTSSINPKRLPKASGPMSNCLEFSKKPLQNHSVHSGHHLRPSAIFSSHHNSHHPHNPLSLLFTSKNSHSLQNVYKHKPRKRWFSHSTSYDVDDITNHKEQPENPDTNNHHNNLLSSSAAEEIQGAIDILAGRTQILASNCRQSACGIRIDRASESEHLLVISKSLTTSKEEFSASGSFSHFDEIHVYSTLFHHSTCYDVLADSSKLVVLDSRLPTLHAIRALLENGVIAAPIWSTSTQTYRGIFTQDLALDLLMNLCKYNSNEDSSTTHTIGDTDEGLAFTDANCTRKSLFTDKLFGWGAKQLSQVLHVMYGYPNSTNENLIIYPQVQLLEALFCLITLHIPPNDIDEVYPRQQTQPANNNNNNDTVETDNLDVITDWKYHNLISHLLVLDPVNGNVLGLLNTDRMLAYLRLRLDELPHTDHMDLMIDSIPGLLWLDRCALHEDLDTKLHSIINNKSPASTLVPRTNESELHKHLPIIMSTVLCDEALELLHYWLPYLPSLPVMHCSLRHCSSVSECNHETEFIGLLTPGDLLNHILCKEPEAALKEPVNVIMNKKLKFFPQHHCVCSSNESIAIVIDRMFRLRTSCLVVFNDSKNGSFKSLTLPIGMVTAKDLLMKVVLDKSSIHYSDTLQFRRHSNDIGLFKSSNISPSSLFNSMSSLVSQTQHSGNKTTTSMKNCLLHTKEQRHSIPVSCRCSKQQPQQQQFNHQQHRQYYRNLSSNDDKVDSSMHVKFVTTTPNNARTSESYWKCSSNTNQAQPVTNSSPPIADDGSKPDGLFFHDKTVNPVTSTASAYSSSYSSSSSKSNKDEDDAVFPMD